METRRWINQSQPQTMQIAVFLLYAGALFALIPGFGNASADAIAIVFIKLGLDFTWLNDIVTVVFAAASVFAGFEIANEKKRGYLLGVIVAAAPLIARLFLMITPTMNLVPRLTLTDFGLIPLMFDIALFALLIHQQSRSYERIWFK